MLVPSGGAVLGIDIGYSERKRTTGVCLLTWTNRAVEVSLRNVPTHPGTRRRELRQLIGENRIWCAAIDAPIRGSLDIISQYRDAEMILTRKIKNRIGKPGQASSGNGIKLNQSANNVANTLLEMEVLEPATHKARIHAQAIVEAFPTTFLGVLLPANAIPMAGRRSDIYYEQLLGPDSKRPAAPPANIVLELLTRLLPERTLGINLGSIVDHEERAAFVCALSALCVARRQYLAVGDKKNGYIILPPPADGHVVGTQQWALDLIYGNAPKQNDDAIIIEDVLRSKGQGRIA